MVCFGNCCCLVVSVLFVSILFGGLLFGLVVCGYLVDLLVCVSGFCLFAVLFATCVWVCVFDCLRHCYLFYVCSFLFLPRLRLRSDWFDCDF